MSRRNSLHVVIATAVAAVMTLGALGVAAAHPVAKASKGNIVICDFFPNPPATTPERVAMLASANSWGKSHGYTVTEPLPPSGGCNGALTQNAKRAADINMMPDDQEGAMYGAHLLAPVSLSPSKYVPASLFGALNGGKYYAYPWAMETMMIYYNKKLVPSSLFKGNYTWDSLAKWSKKFASSHPGEYGMAWQWDNVYYSYYFITHGGGAVFAHTSKGYNKDKLLIDDSGSVKGLEYLKKVIDESGTPMNAFLGSSGNTAYPNLFAQGKIGMVFDGPWSDAQWRSSKIDYGVAAPPKGGSAFLGVQDLVINKFSKHLKAAEQLALYLDTHAATNVYKASNRPPAYKAALAKASKTPELKAYESAFTHTQAMPNIPEFDDYFWGPAGTAFTNYLTGKTSASAALRTAATAIRAQIKAHG